MFDNRRRFASRGGRLKLVAVGVAALCAMNSLAWGQSSISKEVIIEAARAREIHSKTVVVTYKQDIHFASGAMSELFSAISRAKGSMDPVPRSDARVEFVNKLTIDSSKCRFENNEPVWSVADGKLHENSFISVFNGRIAKKLFPSGIGGQPTPRGYVLDNRQSMGGRTYELLPIIWTFRGLQPDFTAMTLDTARFTGREEMIDGTPCPEGYFQVSAKSTVSFWLDSKKDYVLRRFHDLSNGRVIRRLDVSRFEQFSGVWIPVAWTMDEFSESGRIQKSLRIHVDHVALSERVPSAEFEIEFPTGSRVFDQRKSKYYDVGADGSLNETSAREPVRIQNLGRRSLWRLVALVLLSFTVLICLALSYSRWRARRRR